MTAPLTVRVDRTPHKYLNPNAGKHKRTREPYENDLQSTAALRTGEALIGQEWHHDGPITLTLDVAWEKGRNAYVDYDNLVAMNKKLVDGVFSKIGANDRQVRAIELSQSHDPDGAGFVTVTVTPADRP